jgi:hypothetical protein
MRKWSRKQRQDWQQKQKKRTQRESTAHAAGGADRAGAAQNPGAPQKPLLGGISNGLKRIFWRNEWPKLYIKSTSVVHATGLRRITWDVVHYWYT